MLYATWRLINTVFMIQYSLAPLVQRLGKAGGRAGVAPHHGPFMLGPCHPT